MINKKFFNTDIQELFDNELFQEKLDQHIRDNLTIIVREGGWTMPNQRIVEIRFKDETICSDYFDVVQKQEYEG